MRWSPVGHLTNRLHNQLPSHTCQQGRQASGLGGRGDWPRQQSTAHQTPPTSLQARAGLIKNFTGVDDPYEVPLAPEVLVTPYNDGEACAGAGAHPPARQLH